MLERKTLPRHKICSGILSPRGYSFLQENFGEAPDNAFHTPKWVTGVNFLFPNGLQLPMPFIPGPTPHIYRKHADHHVVKASRAEVHEHTEFRDIETGDQDVRVRARRVDQNGQEVIYRAKYVIAADGPRSEVVAKLYPSFRDSIYWFVVGQKYYKADLDRKHLGAHLQVVARGVASSAGAAAARVRPAGEVHNGQGLRELDPGVRSDAGRRAGRQAGRNEDALRAVEAQRAQ